MSRAPSPSPAVPASLVTVTVALCASAKKHQQSFDALREAGERHNERLRAGAAPQSPSTGRTLRADPNAGLSLSPRRSGEVKAATTARAASAASTASPATPGVKPKSRGSSSRLTSEEVDRGTPRTGASRSSSLLPHPVQNCLFRFINLNYDPQLHCMVLCADEAIKGEQPRRPGAAAAAAGEEEDDGTDTATSASEAAAAEAARLADSVDVVLHKVATFGTPSAIRALERWCRQAQKQRGRQRRPPLVVVDPLEKVQLLMTRSMLYKLLDNTFADGRSVALIPRTFMWDRPAGQRRSSDGSGANSAAGAAEDVVVTPLGIHSFTGAEDERVKDTRANGTAQGRWWIAKPDEGTGPAFTHYLVMWCTRNQDVKVPPAVQAALPKEANRFILQELYVYALPVVIKVYCIAPHIYIKVNPTVNLLSHLWECTQGSTTLDVPVRMDSQDKAFFSAVASLSATTSRPALSQVTSGADYGAAAAAATAERSTTPVLAAAASTQASKSGESPHSPVVLSPEALLSAGVAPAPVPWESMIAAGEHWDAFLAPGTPAYTAVSKLAQEMSGYGGIGLTMYGFDIVLVPQHLAHTYQRKSCRGIGHTDGATVKYDTAPSASPAPQKSAVGASSAASGSSGAANAVPLPCKASDMFDPVTGAPTSLLLDSIPVVIDVNYFPGYKGVKEANQHMMELMALKLTQATDGRSPSRRRTDDAAGARDKKRQCASM